MGTRAPATETDFIWLELLATNGNPLRDARNIRAFQRRMRRFGLSNRYCLLLLPTPIEFLCNVFKTSAAHIEADSPLVQSAEFVDGKPVKLRIPDKIAAVKELVRICAWAQPARLELSATDTLADFITSIRQAPPRRPGMAERGGYRIMGSKARCVRARICC